jgi:hypothetical protein
VKKIFCVVAAAGVVALPAVPAVAAGGAAAGSGGAATGGIPKNFLLYEKAVATHKNDEESSWKASGKRLARFVVNPCDKASLAKAGRKAARTLTYWSVPDFQRIEQVILYKSTTSAKSAMKELRAALKKCPAIKGEVQTYRYVSTATALGDEALRVRGQAYEENQPAVGGERSVVVRRANAIMIYFQSGEYGPPEAGDYRPMTRDAKKMLAKICAIAACR